MARTYAILQHHRLLVVGLTIGLVTVLVGVLLDLVLTGQRSSISQPTQKLIAPLNPQLDIGVIEHVEAYEFVSFEQAREGVRQAREQTSTPAVVELMPVAPVPEIDETGGGSVIPSDGTPESTPAASPAQESSDDDVLSIPGEN